MTTERQDGRTAERDASKTDKLAELGTKLRYEAPTVESVTLSAEAAEAMT